MHERARNVLLVALESGSEEEINHAIERRHAVADVHVRVVAPTSNQTALQWLIVRGPGTHGSRGRRDQAAGAVEPEVTTETEVGDRDPLVAVEDALADFPADEIVVAGHPDQKTEAQLRRFGLPVER